MTARARSVAAIAVALAASTGAARGDDGLGGLRAVGRVHSAEPGPSLSIAGDTGYGYTGAVLAENDAHHRVLGGLALAGRPLPWLELGLSLSGRYDKHTGAEPDDGWVGDPRVWASAGGKVAPGTWLAGRVGAWFPGSTAPSIELDATTVDLALALTWSRGALALTATGGYRIDRSSHSADPSMLSTPDRLGLGLSQYDAVLAGVSATHRDGRWEVLGEASWDLLVGSGAPPALESPLRVGVGARRAVGASLRLEALAELSPGQRPDPFDGTLVAIEPRFTATVGFSWRPKPAAPAPIVKPIISDGGDDIVKPPPPPPPPTTGGVRGHVVESDGTPVGGATVALGGREVVTDAQGAWAIDDLPAGALEVAITADGHDPAKQTVTVVAGAQAALEVTVARVAPPAQIRGVIRSFDGKPLAAKIRIEPIGTELTAGDDGTFSVDVAPGSYEVVVDLAGYQSQKRPVKVEAEGVSILNVELRKKKP